MTGKCRVHKFCGNEWSRHKGKCMGFYELHGFAMALIMKRIKTCIKIAPPHVPPLKETPNAALACKAQQARVLSREEASAAHRPSGHP